jgi:hypothetical protein
MRIPTRLTRATAQTWTGPEIEILIRHRAFIRTLPCLSCGKPAPSECAHLRTHAGLGLPSSSRYLVPLCGPATVWEDCCHSRKHYLGATRFWSRLGIEPRGVAFRLWRVSGDVEAGVRVVMQARRAIAASRTHPDERGAQAGSANRSTAIPLTSFRRKLEPFAIAQGSDSGEVALFPEGR